MKYHRHYLNMLQAWDKIGEKPQTWVLQQNHSNFRALVNKFEQLSRGINIPPSYVPSTTFWVYNDEINLLIGAVNIRHRLNENLLTYWGHIGYEVRPDRRRQGYATQILKLALEVCQQIGLEKVLLGCYKENTASAKTILKNDGSLKTRFWSQAAGK